MVKTSGLILIIILNSYLINKIVLTNKLITIPSYITSLIFIILSFPLIHLNHHWGVTISTSLIILIYSEIINLNQSFNIKKTIFKTGFFVGLLSIIDYNFIWLYFIVLVSLLYYSQFNWKHFFIQLIGAIYPIGFYYTLYINNYNIPKNPLQLTKSFHQLDYYFFDYNIFIYGILLLFTLALIELYHNYNKKKENAKKAFNLLIIFAIIFALKVAFLNNLKFIHLLIIPLSIIIANYLIYTKRKKFRTFLLGLLLISFTLNFFKL